MIRIDREPEPEHLANKKDEWLRKFLAKRSDNPSARPDSSKYAHPNIKRALERMSHGKCFYCELELDSGQVDHHVEVADEPKLAFTWENLYLSCARCNQAKRHKHTKLEDCVDPCAPDSRPDEHLTFDDDVIRPRAGSPCGRATIGKYALDRIELDYERARALRELERARSVIDRRRIASGGRPITDDERELLLSFGQPERPFSLMLKIALRHLGG